MILGLETCDEVDIGVKYPPFYDEESDTTLRRWEPVMRSGTSDDDRVGYL